MSSLADNKNQSKKPANPFLQTISSSTFEDLSSFNAIILPAADPPIIHENKHHEERK
jgi:hypothetical protein